MYFLFSIEYFIELDKIESTKASVTLTWKSPQHDDFTQFEVSLWDATHTDRVSEPSLLDADERCYTWTYLDPGMTYTAEVVGVLSDDIQRGKVLVQIETSKYTAPSHNLAYASIWLKEVLVGLVG